jgi:phosphohistidine phosphatase SixA
VLRLWQFQRVKSLAPAIFLSALVGCVNAPAAPAPAAPAAASATTAGAQTAATPSGSCVKGHSVVLLRHAEKAATADKDPDLSDRGRARAGVIAGILGGAGVTRIVATEYHRTQQTVGPLAEKAGLKVEVQPAKNSKELAQSLRDAPDGSLTVVATHSNVVPELARELGAPALRGLAADAKVIAEDDYSRIVILTFACGAKAPVMVEMRSDAPLCAVNLTDRSPELRTPRERENLVSSSAAD